MEQEALVNSSNMDTSFTVVVNDRKDPNNHLQLPVSPPTPLENLNLPKEEKTKNENMIIVQDWNFFDHLLHQTLSAQCLR